MKVFPLILGLVLPLVVSAEIPRIRVGVVAPLTGSAASSGVTIKNSVVLAKDTFAQDGQVEFVFEDDQLLPKNTVNAVNKLLFRDKVDGLIVFGSYTSFATEFFEVLFEY